MAVTREADGERKSFVPTAATRLEGGDLLAVAGAPDALSAVRDLVERAVVAGEPARA